MRLAALLAALPQDELEHVAAEHIRAPETTGKHALCAMLESTIKSFRFVQDLVYSRQPPTFAILLTLLETKDHRFPSAQLRETAMATTQRFVASIDAGDILARADQLRLYRRVLYHARRSDLDIDASEATLLAVLRRELGIAQVEHFLIEHHAELREFWNRDHSFLQELHALRSAGVVFAYGADTVLPADLVPMLRQALGLEMSSADCARLYGYLSNQDLGEALAAAQMKTSGSKEDKLQRLLGQLVQPRFVLAYVSLAGLRDLCREIGTTTSGTKEQLVDRILAHISAGRDDEVEEPPPPPVEEPRALDEKRFKALFSSLRGQQLAAILAAFPDARQSGNKEQRTAVLWELNRSELTLLSVLTNRDLEETLWRLRLKSAGSKKERIDRVVGYFSSIDLSTFKSDDSEGEVSGGDEPASSSSPP
jgi:hypothetical protein